MEEIINLRIPFEMRVLVIRLYKKVTSKFNNNEGCLEEINCNIGVKIAISFVFDIVLFARTPLILANNQEASKIFVLARIF